MESSLPLPTGFSYVCSETGSAVMHGSLKMRLKIVVFKKLFDFTSDDSGGGMLGGSLLAQTGTQMTFLIHGRRKKPF